MMQRFTYRFTQILTILAFTFIFATPLVAVAQDGGTNNENTDGQPATTFSPRSSIADNVCRGVLGAEEGRSLPGTTIDSCRETGDDSFSFIVRRIINIFSIVVGAVSVIMIIIGGFRYIISGGDSSGVSGAKNTILYAIVGLIIVLFAQVIIRFILTNAVPAS